MVRWRHAQQRARTVTERAINRWWGHRAKGGSEGLAPFLTKKKATVRKEYKMTDAVGDASVLPTPPPCVHMRPRFPISCTSPEPAHGSPLPAQLTAAARPPPPRPFSAQTGKPGTCGRAPATARCSSPRGRGGHTAAGEPAPAPPALLHTRDKRAFLLARAGPPALRRRWGGQRRRPCRHGPSAAPRRRGGPSGRSARSRRRPSPPPRRPR